MVNPKDTKIIDKLLCFERLEYDPHACPPDQRVAERHLKATAAGQRVKPDELTVEQRSRWMDGLCPCCGGDPHILPHSMFVKPMSLAHMGAGYVNLFNLIIFLSIMMLLLCIVSGIKIATNVESKKCLTAAELTDPNTANSTEYVQRNLPPCEADWITVPSLANYGAQVDQNEKIAMIVFGVLLYIGLALINEYCSYITREIYDRTDDSSEWTITIKDLPLEEPISNIVKKLEEWEYEPGKRVEVRRVVTAYDCSKYLELVEATKKLKVKVRKLTAKHQAEIDKVKRYRQIAPEDKSKILQRDEEQGLKPAKPTETKPASTEPHTKYSEELQKLKEELKTKKDKKREMKAEMQDHPEKHGTGQYYINVKTVRMARKIRREWLFTKEQLKERFDTGTMKKDTRTYEYVDPNDGKTKKSAEIDVYTPVEPDDIIWKNLPYNRTGNTLRKKRGNYRLLLCLLMFLCGLLAVFFKWLQYNYLDADKTTSSTSSASTSLPSDGSSKSAVATYVSFDALKYRVLSALIVLTIQAVNFGITKLSETTAQAALQPTYSSTLGLQMSFAAFLGIINNCVTPIYSHIAIFGTGPIVSAVWVKGALLNDAFFVLVFINFLDPVVFFVNPLRQWNHLKRWWIRRGFKNGKLVEETHDDIKEVFEKRPFDVVVAYSSIMNLMFCTAWYEQLLPVGVPMCFLGLILRYFVYGKVLNKDSKQPIHIGSDVPKFAIFQFRLLPFAYGTFSLLSILLISAKIQYWDIGIIIASLLFLFLIPYEILVSKVLKCVKRCMKVKEYQASQAHWDDDYDSHRLTFPCEYDRTNPLTQIDASKDYFAYLEALRGKELPKRTPPVNSNDASVNVPLAIPLIPPNSVAPLQSSAAALLPKSDPPHENSKEKLTPALENKDNKLPPETQEKKQPAVSSIKEFPI